MITFPLRALAQLTRLLGPRAADRFLQHIYSPQTALHYPLECITRDRSGLQLHIDTASFLEWYVFFYGDYEPHVRSLLIALLGHTSCVLDVGANVGVHTLALARAAGTVIAVEPNPEVAERLLSNAALNGVTNIELHRCLVSDRTGEARFFLPGATHRNRALASMYRTSDHGESIVAPMRTVDDLLDGRRIDVIKIDAEGHDLFVIRGAERTLEICHPHIVFEFDPRLWSLAQATMAQCQAFLGRFGYTFQAITPRGLRPWTRDDAAVDIWARSDR